ncbi:helix-turn-helix domain-containing protein [Leucobacter weissii]|uniref:Helix-turn-helix domain-containing protein n=1 Tax=Leucobacter weissii TaxID=1983706 RepID=A0A939SBC3_9MICO|nr:helix-turn-helix domain-containing protein [Leucobacter weissii]
MGREDSGDHEDRTRGDERDPLGRIVDAIDEAFAEGDLQRAAELLEQDPLASWYGFRPERFGALVAELLRAGVAGGGFLREAAAMLSPGGASGFGRAEAADDELLASDSDGDGRAVAVALMGRMFALRLQGRPVEALRFSTELERRFGRVQPLFDVYRGMALFSSVQDGITAMLAGDFRAAAERFTQARMHAVISHLGFLSRDACVKLAVLEALYGDPERARSLIDEADDLPRTSSWAEEAIDAHRTIAVSLVHGEDPEASLRALEAVPLHVIGELWPFYVAAMHRTLHAAGKQEEGRRRIELFEGLSLPRADGQGYAGSLLHFCIGLDAIRSGDFVRARERLERADPSLAISRLFVAVLELAVGRPREAMRPLAGLHDQTASLRTLDIWRLAVTAGSLLALGEREECREVLDFVLGLPGGLRSDELHFFPRPIRDFAETSLERWPRGEAAAFIGLEVFPMSGEALTARELDLLRELAGGSSREGIAKSRFISVNTLKAHLRSIYRKLGVGSRAAAVLEAERRGIL